MFVVLCAIISLPLGLLLFAGFRLFVLARPAAANAPDSEIDPSRYKPMERLLRQEDIQFVVSQGLERRSLSQLRAERRVIFRKYLRSLRTDFARVSAMVKVAIVQSPEARPDLAIALAQARISFAYSVFLMEARLSLHAVGYSDIAINVRPAIEALANMRDEWENLLPVPAAAA